MRTQPAAHNDNEDCIQDLQNQVNELSLRTERLEALLAATQTETTPNRRQPRVGDVVTFKPTKITAGGEGRVTRIVRNFVLIARPDGSIVQRAPHNVTIRHRPEPNGHVTRN